MYQFKLVGSNMKQPKTKEGASARDFEHNRFWISGKLRRADVTVSFKQIPLPRDHHVTYLHSGSKYVLLMLRREDWVPRVRTLIRRLIRDCTICIRLNRRPTAPECLAKDQRAFSSTGMVSARFL